MVIAHNTRRTVPYRTLTLLVLASLPWCIAFYLGPIFEVNDDVANIILLREVFGAKSADSSIFLSSIATHALIFLYRHVAGIPWYPLLLYLLLASAQYFLLRLIIEAQTSLFFRITMLAILTAVIARLALQCSFTASSILASGAALVFGLVNRDQHRGREWVMIVLVLTAAFLLRPRVFPITVLALLPVLAAFIMDDVGRLRGVARYFALMMVLVGLVYLVDRAVENQAAFKFREANTVRALFTDSFWGTLRRENFDTALSAAGWSIEDYFVAKRLWWFLDEKVHTPSAMKAFVSVNEQRSILPWARQNLVSNLVFTRYAGVLALIGLFAWLLFENNLRPSWTWLVVALALSCVGLLAGVRFPARVAYPFLLLTSLSLLFLGSSGRPVPLLNSAVKKGLLVIALVTVTWTALIDVRGHGATQERDGLLRERLEAGMNEMLGAAPDAMFVPLMPYGYSEASFITPFESPELRKTLPFGWMGLSPVRRAYLAGMGFDSSKDFVPQLLQRGNVVWYFLTYKAEVQRGVLWPFLRYLNNHYGGGPGAPRLRYRVLMTKEYGRLIWVFFEISRGA